MILTDLFIKRPVFAICLNLIVLIAGIAAYYNLSVRQYPRTDLAVVNIKTVYVGASADLVRGFITTPLERVIASADGIDYLESKSEQGLSTIIAHLKLNFDINAALTQIQAKVAQVRNELPKEAEPPTVDVETSDNRFASMYLSFYSNDLDQNEITDYLNRVVQPQLSAIAGVQKAEILGARVFAMRIWLNQSAMIAHAVTPDDLQNALRQNNYLSALGNTNGSMVQVSLTANTDLRSKEEFEDLVVKQHGNSLIRIKDIGEVVLGAEDYNQDVRFSGQTATFMGIWVLPNANSLEVIQEVRSVLPDIEKRLPRGMKTAIPYDATDYIEDSISEVLKTLSETVIIVIIVIYLFLGSLRSVLVPVVAIPLSLVGAVALMALFGFTINLLTLLAVVLAVGLVVDDAIVVLENVERHVEEGLSPYQAAIKAARELLTPIIAMTITLAAVYAPIGIQGGLTGALFREFAFTLAGAVLVSGFVAITLSPVMSAKLVKVKGSPNRMKEVSDHYFSKLRAFYLSLLNWSLNNRYGVLTFALFCMLLIFPFYMFSAKELAPREDQGIMFSVIQAAPDNTLEQTSMFTKKIYDAYSSFPEFSKSFQLTSPSGGFSGMLLRPWSERSRTVHELEPEAWGKMALIPGIKGIVFTPAPLPGGSDFPVELVISSTVEPEEIFKYAGQLVGAAFQSGKFMFADTDLKYDKPEVAVLFDRDMVNSLGLSLQSVGGQLSVLSGGNYTNRFSIQGRSYKVIAQLTRNERLNAEQLLETHVTTPTGQKLPVETIARIEEKVAPRTLNRFQQLNSAKIQGAFPPGVTLDQALSALEDKAKEILPNNFFIDYAGEARQLRKEGSALVVTLIFAFILIFLVLASQFESFRDPFIILLGSVPLGLAGSLIWLFLGFSSLNIYSQVGLVTLVGLISKNGILIVEFANKLRETGADKLTAIKEAAETRFRPILMTSTATVVGHFPLILASGAGAGARNSIGIVLVSGMIIGTIFTLFVVPVIYLFVASNKVHTKQEEV
jgi:multidrug efflux pump